MNSDDLVITRAQYHRLVRENNRLRDLAYDIATTAPYGRRYVEAIYAARRVISELALSGHWDPELQ